MHRESERQLKPKETAIRDVVCHSEMQESCYVRDIESTCQEVLIIMGQINKRTEQKGQYVRQIDMKEREVRHEGERGETERRERER